MSEGDRPLDGRRLWWLKFDGPLHGMFCREPPQGARPEDWPRASTTSLLRILAYNRVRTSMAPTTSPGMTYVACDGVEELALCEHDVGEAKELVRLNLSLGSCPHGRFRQVTSPGSDPSDYTF